MKHLLLVLWTLLAFVTTAQAERRVALVIGNSQYDNVAPLTNPQNDASGMTKKLEQLGFEVTTGVNLDLREMRRTIHKFVRTLEGADLALFFYAGHGMQVNGNNYLLPTDTQLASYLDLEFETVPTNLILNAMERSTKVNIIFLDACRNNPLAENLARSLGTRSSAVSRGLAKIGSGVGTLISFATQPGNVALDGSNQNSPFTAALLKHLGTPGMEITKELVLVRRDVLKATNGKQVPWDNSSLTGSVVLKQKEVLKLAEPKVDPQIELTFWESIKDGSTIAYFETYLKRYPDGQFADIARIRIVEIEAVSEDEKKKRAQRETEAEITYWQSIQGTEQIEMLESYLNRYPQGVYADLARLKITSLIRRKEKAPSQTRKDANKQDETGEIETAQQIASLSTVVVDDQDRVGANEPLPSNEKELARAVQTELNRLGCSVGRIDGIWGNRSRSALKNYSDEEGIVLVSLAPSPKVLETLKQSEGRVCPLVCGRNQEIKNGKCVALNGPSSSGFNESRSQTNSANVSASCPADPTRYGRTSIGLSAKSYKIYKHPCGRNFMCIDAGGLMGRSTKPMRCLWK
ncbi:caspase family protein [Roseibium album]|uniref:caspase family protein n=1 Tax=Roseibium album TaxID=311410 RepID=UPI001A1D8145|nr:hypothetical protein [Labrenzia sp. EL_195]